MTQHPDPKAIRDAMDRLETEMAYQQELTGKPGYVLMDNSKITRTSLCGTLACFGGWNLLANQDRFVADQTDYFKADVTVFWYQFDPDEGRQTLAYTFEGQTNDSEIPVDYEDGAEILARDLGFDERSDLELWAHYHPELWGNACGRRMFGHHTNGGVGEQAFGFEPTHHNGDDEFLTVARIIEHWRGVADRIEAMAD